MRTEEKAIIVTIFFGIIEVIFNFISIIGFTSNLVIISAILSAVLIVLIIKLYLNYRKIVDSYEFVKFLFFGSDYNGFNFIPKMKLYMDYLGDKNQFEVETIDFECISDNVTKSTNIVWTMKNIHNRTREEIKSYCLYTTSDFGTISGVEMEITIGNQVLNIDTDNVKKIYGVQKTPFIFIEPIKPNDMIPQIKISMRMHNAFDYTHPETVCLYPRNYGKKVNHINICYKTIGVERKDVKLHEIKKIKNVYCDEPIKYSVATDKDQFMQYSFSLHGKEINVDNLYYLLILASSRQ